MPNKSRADKSSTDGPPEIAPDTTMVRVAPGLLLDACLIHGTRHVGPCPICATLDARRTTSRFT